MRPPVDHYAPGAVFAERLRISRRGWGLFAFAVVVTGFAIHPVFVPLVAIAWFASVVRFSDTRVRIDADRISVGRRSVPLASLNLSTLSRGRTPWPWKYFSNRCLVANPVWTRDSVGIRGRVRGRKILVSIGTNKREELVAVLTNAVQAAQRVGPWGPPHVVAGPGWYPDPWSTKERMRWWDGVVWTPFVASRQDAP